MEALVREMELRRNYLRPRAALLETIYFGGGTPSLLTGAELDRIFDGHQSTLFDVSPQAEITLEANPDDLSAAKLAGAGRPRPSTASASGCKASTSRTCG
ncbi:MAG: hypothetical protein WKG07_44975 [Hymenobacter sp.]